jgi:cupin 2 domain-containing protein
MTKKGNIFASLPQRMREEQLTTLRDSAGMCIERIVSHGHASPPGFFYDQEQHEWVIVLRGAARLLVEGDERPVDLKPGDYIDIPAHRRHRVEWTTPDQPTVWLAVHFS